MDITIIHNPEAVTVLQLVGKLDGSNYQDLISEANKLYDEGARNAILDMSGLTFISSAGISALHRVALLFQGQKLASMEEEGWASYHAIANDRGAGAQKHVKLSGPTANVQKSLELVGFDSFFEIFSDVDLAAASFR
jgi:anti-anti-sigma regulatory factor